MNAESPSLVPLQHASLCLDCDVISAAHADCPACGSRALLSIARALNRPGFTSVLYKPQPAIASGGLKSGNFFQST
ncbi:MAG TPA: hypothetical protein VMH85_06640 [Terriglobales bacterium]|nr:hypothetical protein [Terriglobales bacterium]